MKTFEALRLRRLEICGGLFSAQALCAAGVLAMPALLFAPSLAGRALLFVFFALLAFLCGKKNNPLATFTVIFFIVAFNVIVPQGSQGKILYALGAFRITQDSLTLGLERALTLSGLLMISRASIRADLKLPGVFGELVGECFRLFAVITEQKKRIRRKTLIADIDQLMLDLSREDFLRDNNNSPRALTVSAARTKPYALFLLGIIIASSWLLGFFGAAIFEKLTLLFLP